MAVQPTKHSLVERVRQSPPLDIQDITDDSWVKGKTIVITGGASGFGAGFLRRWAKAGAVVIIGVRPYLNVSLHVLRTNS